MQRRKDCWLNQTGEIPKVFFIAAATVLVCSLAALHLCAFALKNSTTSLRVEKSGFLAGMFVEHKDAVGREVAAADDIAGGEEVVHGFVELQVHG